MEFDIFKSARCRHIETVNENRRGVGVAFYESEGISFKKVKGLTSDKVQILTILCENSREKKFPFVVYKVPQISN